jgi:DNA-binding NarL/FixJ family response regulator
MTPLSTLPERADTARDYVRPGHLAVQPSLTAAYANGRTTPHRDPLRRLTGRQQEVLALIAEGYSNNAIARFLSITERAVVRHISNIYDQLDLPVSDDEHRRVRAVLCYIAR